MVWVRIPLITQNARMAELEYAVALDTIQLKVRVLLWVQKIKNKYIELVDILKNFMYICISSLEDM